MNRLAVFMERLKDRQGVLLLNGVFTVVSKGRTEMIRACLGQVIQLTETVKREYGKEGYTCVVKTIVPFIVSFVDHEDIDSRDLARTKLGEIAPLLEEHDTHEQILKVCLELVQNQQKDQNKVAGLKLLGQLAPYFNVDFVKGYVATIFTASSDDANDNVRAIAIEQMAKISSQVGSETVVKYFAPQFKRLSNDPNWQVRLKFVEKVITLAENIPVDKRNMTFGEILILLLKDKTRWVKEAALQQLGYFLALLSDQHKNPKLFEEYLNTPKHIEKMNKEPQNKICLAVAETLPKIISSLGEATWKDLSNLYKLLLKQDDDVKIILARNIPQLSKCLKIPKNKNDLLVVMKTNFLSHQACRFRSN